MEFKKGLFSILIIIGIVLITGCYMEDKLSVSESVLPTDEKPQLSVRYLKEYKRMDVKIYLPYNQGEVKLSISEPSGLKVDKKEMEMTGRGPFAISFYWSALDKEHGGNGISTITVTDARGGSISVEQLIEVPGRLEELDQPPVILTEQTYFKDTKLYVALYDPDPGMLTLTLTEPYGLRVDKNILTLESGNYHNCAFNWSAVDPMAGGEGKTLVKVIDDFGKIATTEVMIKIDGLDHPPQVNSLSYNTVLRALEVEVKDEDLNDKLTFSLSLPEGIDCDEKSYQLDLAGTNGEVKKNFYLYPLDVIKGGEGTATLEVSDQYNQKVVLTTEVVITGFSPEVDTLYAVPQKIVAKVGEEVKIAIISGDTTYNFYSMKRVRILLPLNKGEYVYNSFNVGAFGGAPGDIDGIWAGMSNLSPFSVPPFGLFGQEELTDIQSMAYDFYLWPQNGSELTYFSGYLFNIKVKFSEKGEYFLKFQTYHNGKKTYYCDKSGNEYYWYKSGNDYPGVPHSVLIYDD